MKTFFIKKQKERFRSNEYLLFIRSLPCEVCRHEGRFTASSASHLLSSKYSNGSDACAVPACLEKHHPQSTRSARKVFENAGIDIQLLQEGLWRVFLIAHRLDCPDLVTQSVFEAILTNARLSQPAGSCRKNRPVPF